MTGGYTQGGGIGPLVSRHGMGADQVVEWEVVTGTGELVKATADDHPDLFWALRGGGGSTYGAVVSMTVKAHQDTAVSMAYLTVLNNGTNADALYSAIGVFLGTLPRIVDMGVYLSWIAAPFGFMLTPAIGPGLQVDELDSALQPTIDELQRLGLDYQYSSTSYPNYFPAWASFTKANVSNYNLGGRLVSRNIVENKPDELVAAIRHISSQAAFSGVAFNVANGVQSPDEVATNPYFREALISATLGTPINYTNFTATAAAQDKLTYDLLPALETLDPNGGGYLNEADFQQPNFQQVFYGDHYERLLQIKREYDPYDVFYAKTAVGSEDWEQQLDGRLCKV
ncbi:hypothetical protein SLS62_009254 [Diatrype stigma]|uniref:FAD-binding PCMH-type domain-containing protein n=1 Tax=Diatrype stigma TaxID=117547 RepID=A0AAN9UQI3_9PEZI